MMKNILTEWKKFLEEDSGSGSGSSGLPSAEELNDINMNYLNIDNALKSFAENFRLPLKLLISTMFKEGEDISPEKFIRFIAFYKAALTKDKKTAVAELEKFASKEYGFQKSDYAVAPLDVTKLKTAGSVAPPSAIGATKKAPITKDNKNYIMPFVFPDYEPAVEGGQELSALEKKVIKTITGEEPRKGKCGKVGHAGIIVVRGDGEILLAEFGRYGTTAGKGIIKKKWIGRYAEFYPSRDIKNPEEVAKICHTKTQNEGPNMKMEVVLLEIPKEKVGDVVNFATRRGELDYGVVDLTAGGTANCGTFANDAVLAAGIDVPGLDIFVNPMPVQMLNNLKKISLKTFTVGSDNSIISSPESYA